MSRPEPGVPCARCCACLDQTVILSSSAGKLLLVKKILASARGARACRRYLASVFLVFPLVSLAIWPVIRERLVFCCCLVCRVRMRERLVDLVCSWLNDCAPRFTPRFFLSSTFETHKSTSSFFSEAQNDATSCQFHVSGYDSWKRSYGCCSGTPGGCQRKAVSFLCLCVARFLAVLMNCSTNITASCCSSL